MPSRRRGSHTTTTTHYVRGPLGSSRRVYTHVTRHPSGDRDVYTTNDLGEGCLAVVKLGLFLALGALVLVGLVLAGLVWLIALCVSGLTRLVARRRIDLRPLREAPRAWITWWVSLIQRRTQ